MQLQYLQRRNVGLLRGSLPRIFRLFKNSSHETLNWLVWLVERILPLIIFILSILFDTSIIALET